VGYDSVAENAGVSLFV